MQPSISDAKLSLAQLLARLRQVYQPDSKALAEALHTSYTTYLKTERGRRELSFLMALRICQFYKLDGFTLPMSKIVLQQLVASFNRHGYLHRAIFPETKTLVEKVA